MAALEVRRVAAEQHARELVFQNGLTGRPNRRQFDEKLREAIGSPPRAGALLLDLNGLTQINDEHGHSVGDEVLTIVGQRLEATMRDIDMVARFGGDEFAVLAKHLTSREAATKVAMRITAALDGPTTAGGAVHRVGTGIGIAMVPQDATSVAEVLRMVDVAERRHDGRVSVDTRNSRWCSHGLEIACDNSEKVRVAFALDCCDWEAMGFVATTGCISAADVRDLMVATVEHRFGRINKLPHAIEWLTDNGSCYTAQDPRRFARDIGLVPRTTPVESPQSNGMAEAFVRTLKRDYARVSAKPAAQLVASAN